jgi:tricorn protease
MLRSLFAFFLLTASSAVCAAQTAEPRPWQMPAVSRTQIAFVYAGSIWIVDRQGGEARRLTAQPGEESSPVFSPDGAQLAFSKSVGGNLDVHVVPVAGGELRRLTYHPKNDAVRGWTPDGKQVLFTSPRTSDGFARLYTVPAQGGFPAELPLPMGSDGSYAPDGTRLAYTPMPDPTRTWRNYRGGLSSPIWLAKLADSSIEAIPREKANDREPMWVGEKIYFLSDRTYTVNLFAYDTRTKKVSQLTRFEKYDIKEAAASEDAIVFTQGGALHLYDLKTNQARIIPVRVSGDFSEIKPRVVKAQRWIRTFNLSPDGAHALFGARGEVLTLSADKSEARNHTGTSGVAERHPTWSPDSQWIAYFSDESGEYQLHLRPASGAGSVKKIPVEAQPSFYEEAIWSPDSKRVAFSDKRLALWIVELEKGTPRRIDSSTFSGQGSFRPAWSADSQWLAYSKCLPNRVRTIFLYSVDTGQRHQVTDGRSEADSPVFDPGGKYLYFTASASAAAANIFGMSAFPFRAAVTRMVMAAVLRKDDPSPLLPPSGEEQGRGAAASAGLRSSARGIDVAGLSQRMVRLPLPARNYEVIIAGKPGVLFLQELSLANAVSGEGSPSRTLYKFDLAARKTDKFVEDFGGAVISFDGSRLLYQKGPNWAIVSTDAPPKADEGRLDPGRLEINLDPRAEWRQMYAEAWRVMRDYFYDPQHHGQNLPALQAHYAAYLPGMVTREDLNHVFREMFSHITVSHMQVGGGDLPSGPSANVGLLGADYEIAHGRYRITRIYRGDNTHPLLVAPLTQPGVQVKEGDYLLAVDGQEISATQNLYQYFQGKAGRPVQIKAGPHPQGEGARTFTVMPIPGENTLRDFDEAEANRRKVDELSGGKLGYMFLPDTGLSGYMSFNREFYAQLDKQGLIIDERFNSGGAPADYFIETLRRQPLSYYAFREGDDFPFPMGVSPGPKVMLINEFAGSGGDTLPWMFRQAGLGTLVGKRTWGGGIGGYVSMPELLDGGRMLAPNRAFFNPRKGILDIENHGVAPDIEVEFTPAAWRAGRDPQLEKAVQVALEELKRNPPPRPVRPKYPIHK